MRCAADPSPGRALKRAPSLSLYLDLDPELQEHLGEDLRSRMAPGRVEIDLSDATDAHIREAVARVPETLAALGERRVGCLLLEPGFDGSARRCPHCGLLMVDGDGLRPADGSEAERVEHLREAVVEAALAQDAEVRVVHHHDDLQRLGGIGALLRF